MPKGYPKNGPGPVPPVWTPTDAEVRATAAAAALDAAPAQADLGRQYDDAHNTLAANLPQQAEFQQSAVAAVANIRAQLAAELAKAKELTAKLETKAEIRSEVSEALRLQQEETKRQAFCKRGEPVAEVMPPKPEGVEMFSVKLEKNYRPIGYYEVVGWDKPAVFKKKFGHEKPVQIEAAAFIKDEKAPPAVAGTGFVNKVWSGTTIRLPADEAKHVDQMGIGRRGFD